MTTRGSYVHIRMVKFLGASSDVSCFYNFLKILIVSDMKQFTGILEFIKLYKQNPLENFFPH